MYAEKFVIIQHTNQQVYYSANFLFSRLHQVYVCLFSLCSNFVAGTLSMFDRLFLEGLSIVLVLVALALFVFIRVRLLH